MHEPYRLVVADLMSQTRDLLVRISQKQKRFRHERSGHINESELARALGLRPSTVHRILRLERVPALSEWWPTQKLLLGICQVTAARNEEEALEEIRHAPPVSQNELDSLIRPKKTRPQSKRSA